MDLLAIIQGRINAKLTIMRCSVDQGTGCAPADTHDTSEIEATVTVIETASCTTSNDAYDAFSEPVLTVALKSSSPAIKDEYVIPESNLSPMDQIWGTAEAPVEVSHHLFTQRAPAWTRRQMRPRKKVEAERPPDNQWALDLEPAADGLQSGTKFALYGPE